MRRYNKFSTLVLMAMFCGALSACSELNKDTTHTALVAPVIDEAITDKNKVQSTEEVIETIKNTTSNKPVIELTKDNLVETIVDLSDYEYCDAEYLHDNGGDLANSKVITVGIYDGDTSYLKIPYRDSGVIYFKLIRGEEVQKQLNNVLLKGQSVAIVGSVTFEKTDLYTATTLDYAHIVALGEDAEALITNTSKKLQDKVRETVKIDNKVSVNDTDNIESSISSQEILDISENQKQIIEPSVTPVEQLNIDWGDTINEEKPLNTSVSEKKDLHWVHIEDAITIGAEPLYECPVCGFQHIYGVENPTRYDVCPDCGTELQY